MKFEEVATKTGITGEILRKVIDEAIDASTKAYCPYSKYRVGATLLTHMGIIGGSNVENASYGLTICAERNAISKAVFEGVVHGIDLIAIYAPDGKGMAAPCGACRQFLVEFNPEMWVLCIPGSINNGTNIEGEAIYSLWQAKDLLPSYFGPFFLCNK